MTKKIETFENLSAAMDGEELSEQMLDALLADEAALQKWHEYHLIRDCISPTASGPEVDFMRDERFRSALAEISAEHQAKAAASPAEPVEQAAANNRFFKYFAIVASLAAVAVSVWQFAPQNTETMQPAVAESKIEAVQDENVVEVGAVADDQASAPVMPNSAKQLPEKQPAVGVTQMIQPAQTVVQ